MSNSREIFWVFVFVISAVIGLAVVCGIFFSVMVLVFRLLTGAL